VLREPASAVRLENVGAPIERFGESLRQETMASIEVMRGERENPSPPASAMEALRVAVACEVSREEERPVRVAEIRDDPMGP